MQSPWSIKNPNGDNPNEEEILKPVCFVFDFAPTRALRQLSEYGIGLSPNEPNPENAVKDLVSFLPVLAYDGANMTQIDAGGILDIAMAGTSATLLARKWESALLVNVDNDTLRRILDNPEAMAAVERIEGWRALGDNIIETIINKSEKVKELKNKAKDEDLTEKQKKQLTEEEKEYKSKRKLVQEKLIKFATRIPAFMYLTDFRENTLQDVITKLEPDLFLAVTGLTVKDFHLLVRLKVFNTEQMNQAVFAFRRYEDASLRYTGIESHEGLTHYGLYDTVVAFSARFSLACLGRPWGRIEDCRLERFRRLFLPMRVPVGCAAHHANPQDRPFTFRLGLVDMRRPTVGQHYRPRAEPGYERVLLPTPQTRPAPVLSPPDQFGSFCFSSMLGP